MHCMCTYIYDNAYMYERTYVMNISIYLKLCLRRTLPSFCSLSRLNKCQRTCLGWNQHYVNYALPKAIHAFTRRLPSGDPRDSPITDTKNHLVLLSLSLVQKMAEKGWYKVEVQKLLVSRCMQARN